MFSAKCGFLVGDGEVLWQQNHLWPDRGEAQRHHLHSGMQDAFLSVQGKALSQTKTKKSKQIMLIIAEWRVPETRRDLRCFLFGKIGRHVGQPPAFCHVIYFSCGCFYFHMWLLPQQEKLTMRCSMSFSHKLANGKTRRVMSREEFRLLHYAGEVNYNVNGKM